ncbi:MarR family transcriptional regulator [Lactobacillus sp. DCY120]|uniref:MarR family transcriptional regulator n=1 Tax=Bombilactobacillus apium TaxID=2675299 RepID=A0A850R5B5_9LACO|nr:MarR family transcriptional regulator [Bombilactobacillus apium]NVY95792.1 MarR family transcriptional regulator [Bombilactobacillus apium]
MVLPKKQINQIRDFNRQYTQALGVLDKRLLGPTLNWTEARVLLEIKLNHCPTPLALARLLDLDKSYTSRIIKKLVQKQLVSKTASTQDLRSVTLTLTAKGDEVARDLDQKSQEQIRWLLRNLNAAEQEEFYTGIRKLAQLLTKGKS